MKNEQEKISYLETLYDIINKAVFIRGLNPNEIEVKNSELQRIKKELKYLKSDSKVWNFNFESGGWNTIMAKTKEEAIQKAHDSGYLGADVTSFRIATEDDTKQLMSSFY